MIVLLKPPLSWVFALLAHSPFTLLLKKGTALSGLSSLSWRVRTIVRTPLGSL